MFNVLFDNTSLPVLQQVMSFSEQRQKVLAANLGNVETPGYRQTDLAVDEFTAALTDAVERRDSRTPRTFQMNDSRHVEIDPAGNVRAEAIPVDGLQNYYDGGNRSIERLMTEMSKNELWHRAAVDLFVQQAQLLETAIRERVG